MNILKIIFIVCASALAITHLINSILQNDTNLREIHFSASMGWLTAIIYALLD